MMGMTTLIGSDNNWILFGLLAAIAAVSIWMEQRFRWGSKLTGCIIALMIAMILSNLRIIPTDAPAYDFVWNYIVPAAIPMLLFKADARKIWKKSGRLLVIYLISSLGTILGGVLAYNLLKPFMVNLSHAVPMMIGTYTGGSVNLVAMADAFEAAGDLVSYAVVSDNLIMALYLLLLTAIPSWKFFAGRWEHATDLSGTGDGSGEHAVLENLGSREDREHENSSKPKVSIRAHAPSKYLIHIATAIGLSLLITGVSVTLANFFDGLIPESNFGFALLGGLLGNKYMMITTITVIVASLFPDQVGNIKVAHELGTYLIHIFFAVIGVPASIYLIVTQAPVLLLFCGIIVLCNMVFSFGMSRLLGFSLEETVIASNANIGGPTTAAAMAAVKGWDALLVPAILVGTLGYVIGNYYGIFAGTLLGL